MNEERDSEIPAGTVIQGFKILRKIASGGMGTVYIAEQTALQREVALKVLHDKLVRKDREFVGRFLREASLAAQLNHANVVQVIDAGEDRGVFFLAMEKVEGKSVLELLKTGGAFPETVALEIARQSALALDAAARSQMVHRDIKPDNLIVTTEGVVKVADFGLARNTSTSARLTRAGILMGTPAYISPEQVQGGAADPRSDLYALGITLYEMAVGEKPFRADSVMALLMKHVMDPVPDPRDANPTLSGAFVVILRSLTAKDPTKRFPTAAELLKNLETLPLPPDGRKLLAAFLRRRFPEGAAPAPASDKEWARKMIEEAKARGGQKDFQSALSLLRKGRFTASDPQTRKAFEEETERTAQAERIHLNDAKEAMETARSLAERGDVSSALDAFRSVAQRFPGTAAAREAERRLGEIEAAGHREARYDAVREALARGDAPGAKRALATARRTPASGDAGRAREADFEKEIHYLECLDRARALQGQGRSRDAEEAFARARALFDRKEARVGCARMRYKVWWERAEEANREGDLKKEYRFLNQAKSALESEGLKFERAFEERYGTVSGLLANRQTLKTRLKEGKGFESAQHWSRARAAYREALDLTSSEEEKAVLTRRIGYVARREDLFLDNLLERSRAAARDGANRRACEMLRAYIAVRKADPSAGGLLEQILKLPDGVRLEDGEGASGGSLRWIADGAAMVLVPGGPFFRGSKGIEKDEEPEAQVGLSSFLLDREPVTNGRYALFLEWLRTAPDPHRHCHPLEPPGKDHKPGFWDEERWNGPDVAVVGVDWFDAWAFASWAGKSLPTESQWEKAARGTTRRTYPWGETPPSAHRCSFFDAGLGRTTPSSARPGGASPFGALDMAGNVLEWCADFYGADFYGKAASREPDPANLEDAPKRVLRGGSWVSVAKACRAAYRDADFPTRRNNYIGFRCVAPAPS